MTKRYLVIGGGTAGAVLAARLSESSAHVVLLEAGEDVLPQQVAPDIKDAFPSASLNSDYFWKDLKARRRPSGALYPYPQAKVLGGGSSINGMWTLRGLPTDFEQWVQAGALGWSWQEVLPFFRKAEGDVDRKFQSLGPFRLRRPPEEELPGFIKAARAALLNRDTPTIEDINEDPGCGFFTMPYAAVDGVRSSTASCYLTAEVRTRPNLEVITGAIVQKLILADKKACGTVYTKDGLTHRIEADEIMVCAGGIHSPAILMRSGIGDSRSLRTLGIQEQHHLPGVGNNLQNHPYLQIAFTLRRAARQPARVRTFASAGVRHSSGLAGTTPGDLFLAMLGRVSARPFGTALGMFSAALYAPLSRGRVTLASADPAVPPRVEFNFLQHPLDAKRMLVAARFAESLLSEPEFKRMFTNAFIMPPVMAANQFNKPGLSGWLMNVGAKILLNGPSFISRRVLAKKLMPGRWIAGPGRSAPLTDEELLNAIAPMGHPVGTCKMGNPSDPGAVVDHQCRVIGIQGLRVVDASIMPVITSANTSLTAIMIAEKIAEHMLPPESTQHWRSETGNGTHEGRVDHRVRIVSAQ